ncbi:hypothetical protein A2574_00865 [Candidatus Shapirobacteria bacterium RIFOXYD1_FULL_38_32]|uniref:HTH cro/C1-type domain-containing protein n=2 Tax=Candidatus Shapironibacteriota TaxID=1752721 RepID=A0A0G0JP58_9BACT|nr:MAG: hypothetical protein US90_C0022G0015 [Candidatus Shapirobacteria bacterium GW2011_GWE2_38_30]OGL55787.1 MAG: hypothetical protein A2195_00355 [Candidatus Shapirobacteria bacterium RIFOXYA1_FULL_39_17]OGL56956.1 MAG: hypothetical protein A2367_03630 [Candidatus Shapirobacteria bacterium RIFOXYB1_FULL_38_38]OGL57478.1 MAG: hypothetical protein A2410_00595 [Candidatus Shapirobacteria bacterium RIFOXYC1_FULL_38_24]OGL58282.1 MAG: hypothetical protein A2574_00865 [Candidatus Shapirobacteria 
MAANISLFKASTILKNTRLDKELELEEISKKIKIPKKYLEAIESGDISLYPQEPYCSLFVRDYAEFLKLNSTDILSLFRRDFLQVKHKSKNKLTKFGFTPQITFTIILTIIGILFIAYLTGEYIKFNRPPKLTVNWPETEYINQDNFEVTGKTDPESTVRVNQDLVIVDNQGNFSKKINLDSPQTQIIIESKSANGKTTITKKIIYKKL